MPSPYSLNGLPGYRGDDTIKLYDWMEVLREQAQQAGGNVISHLGNHEWMNVIGTLRCTLQATSS